MELNTQVGGMSLLLFGALKFAGLLRVSPDVEEAGMDVSKHGGTAYEKDISPVIPTIKAAEA